MFLLSLHFLQILDLLYENYLHFPLTAIWRLIPITVLARYIHRTYWYYLILEKWISMTMDCHCTDILYVRKYQGLFIVSVSLLGGMCSRWERGRGGGERGAIAITERALQQGQVARGVLNLLHPLPIWGVAVMIHMQQLSKCCTLCNYKKNGKFSPRNANSAGNPIWQIQHGKFSF